MIGTIVNVLMIVFGSALGLILGKKFTENLKKIVLQGVGLAVILIGIQMALKTSNIIIVIFSLAIGGILGELIGLEKKLEDFGAYIEKRVGEKGDFVKGFVTSSLIYCVGPMAVLGAIEDGLNSNPSILYVKSTLDGTVSVALASAMGVGVMFSVIPVFLYQGGITLLSNFFGNFIDETIVNEMTATGGLLIVGIGLNILEIKNIKVGNLLPSIFIVVFLALIFL